MKVGITFVLMFLGVAGSVISEQVLTSPILTNWGTWGTFEYCPPGTKVVSMQVKVEPWDSWDGFVDDTCLNSIKFGCGDPRSGEISRMLTSKEGNFGRYGNMHNCNGDGYAIGFMIRVEEEDTAIVDETATNNLRILCAGSESGFIELDGERWGEWTNPRICDPTEYICGLQTQVEDPQGIFTDDTSLNNIRVKCCDLSEQDMTYYGINKTSFQPS